MESLSAPPPCPGCLALRAEVDALKHLLLDMRQQMDALQCELSQTKAELAQRQEALAKARKNSSNSSKPPSSDIVKPKKSSSRNRRKRKIGGQPGHPKHERTFCLEEADEQHPYSLDTCPKCTHRSLEALPGAEKITYQYELYHLPI